MNVKNTVQHIHHTIIQVYLLPYKIGLGCILSFTNFEEEPFTDTLVASTNTFFSVFTVSPWQRETGSGLNPRVTIFFNTFSTRHTSGLQKPAK